MIGKTTTMMMMMVMLFLGRAATERIEPIRCQSVELVVLS